jgi:LPXTG-motif cell wall-anchored protein
MIKRALTVIVAVGALLAVSTPAQSQEYPPPTFGVFVSDSTVFAGQIIIIQAGVFAPGSTVTFNFFSQPVTLGTASADASGVATLEAQIPTTATPGEHTIVASGVAADGSPLEVSTSITVLADDAAAGAGAGAGGAGGDLPTTGSDSLPIARVGAALLAVGGGLLFVTRRRRAAATA